MEELSSFKPPIQATKTRTRIDRKDLPFPKLSRDINSILFSAIFNKFTSCELLRLRLVNKNWQAYIDHTILGKIPRIHSLSNALHSVYYELEPLADALVFLKDSTNPAIEKLASRLDYPEIVCTRNLVTPISNWRTRPIRKNKLIKLSSPPLQDLQRLLHEIASLSHLSNDEEQCLGLIRSQYKIFIKSICQTKGDERLKLFRGPARLYDLHKVWRIKPKEAYQIASINKYNETQKKNTYGAGAISQMNGVYFKQKLINPLFPGRHFAAYQFSDLVFGEGITTSRLLKLSNILVQDVSGKISIGTEERKCLNELKLKDSSTKEIFYKNPQLKAKYPFEEKRVTRLLQTSQSIKGKNLLNYLQSDTPHLLQERSTSVQFCLALLLCSSSNRADDFVVDEYQNIVGTDYDQVFGPPVGNKHNHPYLNLRNICLLLPQRTQPLEPSVLRQLVHMRPVQIIYNWLHGLQHYNKKHQDSIHNGWLTENDVDCCSLPVRLPLRAVLEAYRRLIDLKKAASTAETRWDIFQSIYPPIATLYEQVLLKADNDPLKAQSLLFPRGSLCWIEDFLSPNDDLFHDLQTLCWPNNEPTYLPQELTKMWLATVPKNQRPSKDAYCFITQL